jgi:hypothetical protein
MTASSPRVVTFAVRTGVNANASCAHGGSTRVRPWNETNGLVP